jgi:hypothetical protein
VDTLAFIKDRVGLFKDFTPDPLKEAIMVRGAEATHSGVVLGGEVVAGSNSQTLGELKAGETFGSWR